MLLTSFGMPSNQAPGTAGTSSPTEWLRGPWLAPYRTGLVSHSLLKASTGSRLATTSSIARVEPSGSHTREPSATPPCDSVSTALTHPHPTAVREGNAIAIQKVGSVVRVKITRSRDMKRQRFCRFHGPVIASMIPGVWMFANSVLPSGEKVTPVNSLYSGFSSVPMLSSLRAIG